MMGLDERLLSEDTSPTATPPPAPLGSTAGRITAKVRSSVTSLRGHFRFLSKMASVEMDLDRTVPYAAVLGRPTPPSSARPHSMVWALARDSTTTAASSNADAVAIFKQHRITRFFVDPRVEADFLRFLLHAHAYNTAGAFFGYGGAVAVSYIIGAFAAAPQRSHLWVPWTFCCVAIGLVNVATACGVVVLIGQSQLAEFTLRRRRRCAIYAVRLVFIVIALNVIVVVAPQAYTANGIRRVTVVSDEFCSTTWDTSTSQLSVSKTEPVPVDASSISGSTSNDAGGEHQGLSVIVRPTLNHSTVVVLVLMLFLTVLREVLSLCICVATPVAYLAVYIAVQGAVTWDFFFLVALYLAVSLGVILVVRATLAVTRKDFRRYVEVHEALRRVARHRAILARVLDATVPHATLPHITAASTIREASVASQSATAAVVVSGVADFDRWSTTMLPGAVVRLLHELFSAYDAAVKHLDMTKAATYGDRYVACAGVHPRTTTPPLRNGTPAGSASKSQKASASASANPTGSFGNAPDPTTPLPASYHTSAGSSVVLQQQQQEMAANVSRAVTLALSQGQCASVIGARFNPPSMFRAAIAVGELCGAIDVATKLRYCVSGPALDTVLALLEHCPPQHVVVDQAAAQAALAFSNSFAMWGVAGTAGYVVTAINWRPHVPHHDPHHTYASPAPPHPGTTAPAQAATQSAITTGHHGTPQSAETNATVELTEMPRGGPPSMTQPSLGPSFAQPSLTQPSQGSPSFVRPASFVQPGENQRLSPVMSRNERRVHSALLKSSALAVSQMLATSRSRATPSAAQATSRSTLRTNALDADPRGASMWSRPSRMRPPSSRGPKSASAASTAHKGSASVRSEVDGYYYGDDHNVDDEDYYDEDDYYGDEYGDGYYDDDPYSGEYGEHFDPHDDAVEGEGYDHDAHAADDDVQGQSYCGPEPALPVGVDPAIEAVGRRAPPPEGLTPPSPTSVDAHVHAARHTLGPARSAASHRADPPAAVCVDVPPAPAAAIPVESVSPAVQVRARPSEFGRAADEMFSHDFESSGQSSLLASSLKSFFGGDGDSSNSLASLEAGNGNNRVGGLAAAFLKRFEPASAFSLTFTDPTVEDSFSENATAAFLQTATPVLLYTALLHLGVAVVFIGERCFITGWGGALASVHHAPHHEHGPFYSIPNGETAAVYADGQCIEGTARNVLVAFLLLLSAALFGFLALCARNEWFCCHTMRPTQFRQGASWFLPRRVAPLLLLTVVIKAMLIFFVGLFGSKFSLFADHPLVISTLHIPLVWALGEHKWSLAGATLVLSVIPPTMLLIWVQEDRFSPSNVLLTILQAPVTLLAAYVFERSSRRAFAISKFADACSALAAERAAVHAVALQVFLPEHVLRRLEGEVYTGASLLLGRFGGRRDRDHHPNAPRPLSVVEHWSALCVVAVTLHSPAVVAHCCGPLAARRSTRRRSQDRSQERSPREPGDNAPWVARAVSTAVDAAGGGSLHVVETLGDTYLVAGPLNVAGCSEIKDSQPEPAGRPGPRHSDDERTSGERSRQKSIFFCGPESDARSPDSLSVCVASRRAVDVVRRLTRSIHGSGYSFTAALVVDDAYGALLGTDCLSYRLFGVATRSAHTLLKAAPTSADPVAVATREFRLAFSDYRAPSGQSPVPMVSQYTAAATPKREVITKHSPALRRSQDTSPRTARDTRSPTTPVQSLPLGGQDSAGFDAAAPVPALAFPVLPQTPQPRDAAEFSVAVEPQRTVLAHGSFGEPQLWRMRDVGIQEISVVKL